MIWSYSIRSEYKSNPSWKSKLAFTRNGAPIKTIFPPKVEPFIFAPFPLQRNNMKHINVIPILKTKYYLLEKKN